MVESLAIQKVHLNLRSLGYARDEEIFLISTGAAEGCEAERSHVKSPFSLELNP